MKKSVKKMLVVFCIVVLTLCVMSVTAFASTPSASIDSTMLEGILDSITANVGVILPIGIGIFSIMLGIKFVPRIFKMFTRG